MDLHLDIDSTAEDATCAPYLALPAYEVTDVIEFTLSAVEWTGLEGLCSCGDGTERMFGLVRASDAHVKGGWVYPAHVARRFMIQP